MHFGAASFRRLQTASSGPLRRLASYLKPSLSYHADRWIVKGVKPTWLSVLSTILYDVPLWQLTLYVILVYIGSSLLLTIFLYPAYSVHDGAFTGEIPEGFSPFIAVFCMSMGVLSQTAVNLSELAPSSYYTIAMVTAFHFLGILIGAVVLGVLINRVSIPRARVVFSNNLLLTTRNGEPLLIFRLGNTRGNFLLHPEIRMSLMSVRDSPIGLPLLPSYLFLHHLVCTSITMPGLVAYLALSSQGWLALPHVPILAVHLNGWLMLSYISSPFNRPDNSRFCHGGAMPLLAQILLGPTLTEMHTQVASTVEGENVMQHRRLEIDEPTALAPSVNVSCRIQGSPLEGKQYWDLEKEGAVIIVSVQATDNQHFQEVFARKIYTVEGLAFSASLGCAFSTPAVHVVPSLGSRVQNNRPHMLHPRAGLQDLRFNCRFADLMQSSDDGIRAVDFRQFNRILPNASSSMSWGLTESDMAIINGFNSAFAAELSQPSARRLSSQLSRGGRSSNGHASVNDSAPLDVHQASAANDERAKVAMTKAMHRLGLAQPLENSEEDEDSATAEPRRASVSAPRKLASLASKRGTRSAPAARGPRLDEAVSLRNGGPPRIPLLVCARESDDSAGESDADASEAPELHMHEARPVGLDHVVKSNKVPASSQPSPAEEQDGAAEAIAGGLVSSAGTSSDAAASSSAHTPQPSSPTPFVQAEEPVTAGDASTPPGSSRPEPAAATVQEALPATTRKPPAAARHRKSQSVFLQRLAQQGSSALPSCPIAPMMRTQDLGKMYLTVEARGCTLCPNELASDSAAASLTSEKKQR